MKYKRVLFPALITVLLLLFSFALTITSSAAQTAIITVEGSDLAVAGGEFTLSATLSDNPGFSKAQLNVGYNKSYLSIVSVTAGDVIESGDVSVNYTDNKNGSCAVSIDIPYDVSEDGVLLNIRFKLASSVKLNVSYPVTLGAEMLNSSGKTVGVTSKQRGFLLTCAHVYSKTVAAPTCQAEGFTLYRCSECQKSYQDDYVQKLPHTWKTIRTKSATCTEDGTLEHTCTVCGYNETVLNGSALGHKYQATVHPATCQTEGYTDLKCKRCNAAERVDFTPKIDHVLKERVRLEPTCREKGILEHYCEMCGIVFSTDDIPMISHDFVVKDVVEPTHDAKGYTSYECSYCKMITRDNYTDKKPYDLVTTVEVEPTCEHTGRRVTVCSDGCGYRVEDTIPLLAHSFGEWEVITPAGIDTEGLEQHVCSVCGIAETSVIPALEDTTVNPPDPIHFEFSLNTTTVVVIGGAVLLILMIIVFLIVIFKAMRRKTPVK